MMSKVTNIVIAGLGGQGVLKASDILGDAVFRSGFDIKKAEVHGMSQRGGSVCSDVRFGDKVYSPMAPPGEADFLVVLAEGELESNRQRLREGGVLIAPDSIDAAQLPNKRSLNVALLGVLSRHLDLSEEKWLEAICANFPEKIHEINFRSFELGRNSD